MAAKNNTKRKYLQKHKYFRMIPRYYFIWILVLRGVSRVKGCVGEVGFLMHMCGEVNLRQCGTQVCILDS